MDLEALLDDSSRYYKRNINIGQCTVQRMTSN